MWENTWITSPAGCIFEIRNAGLDGTVDCDLGAKKLIVVYGGGGDCKSVERSACGILICADGDADAPDTLGEVGNSCKPASRPATKS